jgi:hypothetical protein
MVAVIVDKRTNIRCFVIYFLSAFEERQNTVTAIALQRAEADMKHKAQILIVQQFVFLIKNIIGTDKRFQVFAYFVQFRGQPFHPFRKVVVVYKHNALRK